ncbi:Tex family protein [Floccifex sp.]|uniref:Tex family protein n=1 Tax=Floccifex sp. TaxID=2815810 RepID=UPI002A765015|nr:Tex family protein [Floccifex sp.]MDD7281432.1 Tex family protein [Erysipelotrichaceae bacterium]MDY2957812.1 Tex family protein [Floccifex sp.]
METQIKAIAQSLNIKEEQVQNVLNLLQEGATVPFIARYRKEMTGALDEEQIQTIDEEYKYQVNLQKRKEDVCRLIETKGKLTEELKKEIEQCTKISQVDDIYRPYQEKKKTRATEAIRKGLQPLANLIYSCPKYFDGKEAQSFLNEEVKTIEEALQGACDIIAEMVSDNAKLRWRVKESIEKYGRIVTKAKKDHNDEKKVYQLYYDFSKPVKYLANHQIMAINRAEKEKVITVSFEFNEENAIRYALRGITRDRNTQALEYIEKAVNDGCKRLLFPSVEREIRSELSAKAQTQSIEVFSMNLEKLLMQPPLKGRTILGFDPGYAHGCKLATLDATGKLLQVDKIYPHAPQNKKQEAQRILVNLIKKFTIEIIAIGNGTASRESEEFVAKVIQDNHLTCEYIIVSEAGASVYSAQEEARQEFPDLQVEERSAVSIARRVLDPLSELIKIDPQSIGVGQYQHDLPQKQLKERLDFVVTKSVNRVGVNINTASPALLCHVAGLSKNVANEIIKYRNENGEFTNRDQIKKVNKLGPKAFVQCAGFLRIENGQNPLDATGIHPESYGIANELIKKYHVTKFGQKFDIDIEQAAQELNSDVYTIQDIVQALQEPQRDYRDQYDAPKLRSDILHLEDLKIGQELEGTVRNVVDFGAFVDIGLHSDGLIHISKCANHKISHPSEVLAVGDIVHVWVSNIDYTREKVQLSIIPTC